MNTFLKRLMEFADYVGVIDSFSIFSADYASVAGKTRHGRMFNITVHFMDVEEEEQNGN